MSGMRRAAGARCDATVQHLPGKYMSFRLGGETYGIEILKVREIIGAMDIARVPRAPALVRGVINLRGKVIPVIDLRVKFDAPQEKTSEQAVIIVVQVEIAERSLTMGVLVDEVLEVLSVDAPDLEPPPDLGDGLDSPFILAVAKVEKRVVFLVDIARVLTREEMGDVTQAAA